MLDGRMVLIVLARLMENMYFPKRAYYRAPISGKRPCSQTKVIAAAVAAGRKIDAMRRPSA